MDVTYEGTKREVATDKGTLRYHEAGDGPPLILLHGSGIGVSGWRNYRGNLEVFAKHFHCYILEFPGFGVSDPVDGHPVITAASSVIRFMDALGIESAAMIGNSMGGVVGVNVAMRFPERVCRLVTIGGVGPNIFSQNPSEGTRLLQDFADAPSREKLVRWLECMVYDKTVVTEARIEERWETANDPASHQALTAMYGSKAFAAQQQMMSNSDVPPYWVDDAQGAMPDLADMGARRQAVSTGHADDSDATDSERRTACIPELRALGDDRSQGGIRAREPRVPASMTC